MRMYCLIRYDAPCDVRGGVAKATGPTCLILNREAIAAEVSNEATPLLTNTSNTRTEKLRPFGREKVGDIPELP